MKHIVLFGAGKSATVLIDYLLEHAKGEDWFLHLVDADLALAEAKLNDCLHGTAYSFDIADEVKRDSLVKQADVVISMLPPFLHKLVADSCVEHGRHLLTASYVDDHMRSLREKATDKGILFLCEMGLDPGIDHMSAMALINGIVERGGRITGFHSHCGGLIAPESDDNPWHYKISWNPRNIVMAGSAGAVFRKDGNSAHLSYQRLFAEGGRVSVEGEGDYAYYANRDSLSYMPLYGLDGARNFMRTTLRHPDFMEGWQHVVKLGLSNEQPVDRSAGVQTYAQWLQANIAQHTHVAHFESYLHDISDLTKRALVKHLFEWIGFTGDEPIPAAALANVDVLQTVIEAKLQLKPGDRDMIIMLHEVEYEMNGETCFTRSSLVVKGTDNRHTAMAKTVGLPLAIATKLLLGGQLPVTGVRIPTHATIYEPVLKELELSGIHFRETTGKGTIFF